ncbi:thioredoxin domain-containing protein [Streptomyces sp. NPDC085937]|uniref:thioredoxin domain-containing protein n=1 Tax=Streptomyces sp. NPDC085937 TaxID=3365742 RepID=UPI0037D8FBFB
MGDLLIDTIPVKRTGPVRFTYESRMNGGGDGVGARPDLAGFQELPEELAEDGVTILVGDPDATTRVRLYEDQRCPYCAEFKTTGGAPALQEGMLARQARTEYTLASFLDDRVGGTGSKKAVNALRAALEQRKFVEYHEVLYANQPEESVDGFTGRRPAGPGRQGGRPARPRVRLGRQDDEVPLLHDRLPEGVRERGRKVRT